MARIRFFFPRPKCDHESQTTIIFARPRDPDPIPVRMRSMASRGIIFQDPRPTNGVELSYMLDYSPRLAFFSENPPDHRFDPLTPPPTLFDEIPIGFSVYFRPSSIDFVNSDQTRTVGYIYDGTSIPMIEALETGFVNYELLSVLRRHLRCENWDDGHILCQIVDCRFSTSLEYRKMLRIEPSVISAPMTEKMRASAPGRRDLPDPEIRRLDDTRRLRGLESERQILLTARPTVCVDPSPDVARVQSVSDWRQKQWARRRPLERSELVLKGSAEEGKAAPTHVRLEPLNAPVFIPDAILQVFHAGPRGIKTE
jgi:hypothetical protein